MCNSTGAIGSVVFNCVKQVVVYVAWALKFCFRGVTHELMSSVFEVLLLFWFLVMSVLSSWDEMDVLVELLPDDALAAEYDKTVFFSAEVDTFDWLYLKDRPISLPMVQVSTIKRNYDKWG